MLGFSGRATDAARPKLTPRTVLGLNNALRLLLNNPDPGYRGLVLGDLGGHRGKIMDDLGDVLAHTLAGIKAAAPKDPDAILLQSLMPLGVGMALVLALGGWYFVARFGSRSAQSHAGSMP